jgi:tRNA threonylcarbamoyladenosine biosynthesis protein TsaB
MIILTIRTDRPEAEVGLFDDHTQLAYETWEAHRQLAETLHLKIKDLLTAQGKDWHSIQGIVCFAGPGSFTGLRIGITVADALAYGLAVPVVASKDPDWLYTGIDRLGQGEDDTVALPEYGAPVHITQQKK